MSQNTLIEYAGMIYNYRLTHAKKKKNKKKPAEAILPSAPAGAESAS